MVEPPEFPTNPPLEPPAPPAPMGTIPPGGVWPTPPEPGGPPPRRVSTWVVAVAIVAAFALLGGLVAVVSGGDDEPDDDIALEDAGEATTTTTTEAPDPTTSTTLPSSTGSDDIETVVAEIEDFVSAERGLPWLREVTVELADDEEFEARLLARFEEDIPDIVTTGQVLQALGLVEPGLDMVEALRTLLGGGVVGFYNKETDELVVRGTNASPYVRTVIAHELTHALEDQHFELFRPELDDADDESGFGFTGLMEGSASHVEQAYRDEVLTPDEQDQAAEEERSIGSDTDFSEIPLVLLESISAPYILGPELVDVILQAGGQVQLDASFVTPPTTSEQLLEPDVFLEGQGAATVPEPVADGVEIDRGVVGELGLLQLLGLSTILVTGFGELPDEVQGWGGDRYIAWADGDRFCVRANFVGDSADDSQEIASALATFANNPPFSVEASVDVTPEVITLTSCG